MLFSSLIFLFLFLPAVLLTGLVPRDHGKNILLIGFSMLFYAWGGVGDTVILIGSILVNHVAATKIRSRTGVSRKQWLQIGISLNVLLIVSFKYLGFFTANLNLGLATLNPAISIPILKVGLPLGISFFTFQQMSMLWDIYLKQNVPKLKLSETALYVCFFPQLIAGPIVRYHDIIDQIRSRTMNVELFHSGVQRFIIGLFKKVIIANTCATLADPIFSTTLADISTQTAWLAAIAFTFQVYFDFSGYSDMAIGIGRMLGFRILENFNFPYVSNSLQEFWTRWHISLSRWFKDYLYIPLGGNRLGTIRTNLNLLTVFILVGLWHGATWNFVFFGIYHGFFLVVERYGFSKVLGKLPSPVSWFYTIMVVLIGCVFFRFDTMGAAFEFIQIMFLGGSETGIEAIHLLDREKVFVLLTASVFSTTLPVKAIGLLKDRLDTAGTWHFWLIQVIKAGVLMSLLFMCVMYQNAGSYDPFIYFRF